MIKNGSEDELKARRDMVEIGRRLWQRGLVSANDGNLSVRLGGDHILCTPSGVSKGFLYEDDLVITDLVGTPVDAERRPSSELKMHVFIYRMRADVQAIVHAHPPHATAFALLGTPLPRFMMPEMEVLLGPVELLPYRTPGTQEFANAFANSGRSANAFLLGNHGATTVGRTLEEAWFRMESLDQSCRVLMLAAQAGKPKVIPEEYRAVLESQRDHY